MPQKLEMSVTSADYRITAECNSAVMNRGQLPYFSKLRPAADSAVAGLFKAYSQTCMQANANSAWKQGLL